MHELLGSTKCFQFRLAQLIAQLMSLFKKQIDEMDRDQEEAGLQVSPFPSLDKRFFCRFAVSGYGFALLDDSEQSEAIFEICGR